MTPGSKIRSLVYISVLLGSLYFAACNPDEEEIIPDFPEALNCDEYIGTFHLLPSSLDYTPYHGKDSVAFIDSLGTELKFSVQELEINTFKGALIKHGVFSAGDTVRYCYETEGKSFILENIDSALEFRLTIEANPDYSKAARGYVSDVFNIWYTHPNPPPYSSSQVFLATIDIRTGTYSDNNIVIPQMSVFGKTFLNVERTNFSNPKIVVWYNQKEGIVCFRDANGKRWRWNGFN